MRSAVIFGLIQDYAKEKIKSFAAYLNIVIFMIRTYDPLVIIIFSSMGGILIFLFGVSIKIITIYILMGVIISACLKISNDVMERYFRQEYIPKNGKDISESIYEIDSKEKYNIEQKIRENRSRFFNGALIAVAVMIPSTIYVGSQRIGVDFKTIGLFELSTSIPRFDEELRDLDINSINKLSSDNFPILFSSHVKYGNDNIKLLSRMQSISKSDILEITEELYENLLTEMFEYVRLATELQELEYYPNENNRPQIINIRSKLSIYPDRIKSIFGKFKINYCQYINSPQFQEVSLEVSEGTQDRFKLVSGYCLNRDVVQPLRFYNLR